MFTNYAKAPKYKDFRQMLDKENKNIDAVIVTIPDFMHATAAIWAMERGKHVYVQKPLTRTSGNARELTQAAAKYKVATQMGNQGYSNEGTRQCAEMIWSGAIGNVTEVHAWTNRPIWPQGMESLPTRSAGAGYARLGSLAGHPEHASVQSGVSAVRLARLSGFRLRLAGRYGVPYPGRAQYGAAAGRAHERGVHARSKARAITPIRRNRSSGSTFRPAAPCRR